MNNSIILNGKNYSSSRQAASLVGYSTDYVGQLCRAGKLECTRIGRVWYVTEESILNHKKKADEALGSQYKNQSEQARSVPYLSQAPSFASTGAEAGGAMGSMNYFSDDRDLFPDPHRTPSSTSFFYSPTEGSEEGEQLFRKPAKSGRRMFSSDFSEIVLGSLLVASMVLGAYSLSKDSFFENMFPGTASHVLGAAVAAPKTGYDLFADLIEQGYGDLVNVVSQHPYNDNGSNGNNQNNNAGQAGAAAAVAQLAVANQNTPTSPATSTAPVTTTRYIVIPNIQTTEFPTAVAVSTQAPVTEKIIDDVGTSTVTQVVLGDITAAQVEQKIQDLSDQFEQELDQRLSGLSSGGGAEVNNVYQEVAQTQAIDQLDNVAITDPTITGGNISGVSISGSSGAFSGNINSNGLTVTGTSTFSGPTTFAGITGAVQCLHVDANGDVSGTGTDCGSGGGGASLSLANIWTGAQTFNAPSTFTYASTTEITATTASTTNLVISGITGTQCLSETGGVVSGTGSTCSGPSYLTNSGSNSYLNTGSNLEAPIFTATSSTGLSVFNGTITGPGSIWSIDSAGNIAAGGSLSIYKSASFDEGDVQTSGAGNLMINSPTVFSAGQGTISDDGSGDITCPGGLCFFSKYLSLGTTVLDTVTGKSSYVTNLIDSDDMTLASGIGGGTNDAYEVLLPSVSGNALAYSDYFTAGTTTRASFFPYASTTAISATNASTTNLNLGIFGSTQCLHVNSSGTVSGTGSDCGSSAVGGSTNQIQYNNGGSSLGGVANFQQSGGNINILPGGGILQGGDNFLFASTTNLNYAIGNTSQSKLNTTESGTDNISLGDNALNAVTTGGQNYCIGASACVGITSSSQNFALGGDALEALTNGATGQNVAIGVGAMQFAHGDTGENVMIGTSAGGGTSATYQTSVGIGWDSLLLNNGNSNSGFGSKSCASVSTGTNNTCLGVNAGTFQGGLGVNLTTGSNDLFVGSQASVGSSTISSSVAIGENSVVGENNAIALGGIDGDAVKVGIGTTSPWALFSLATTSPVAPFFTIASSTNGTATSTIFIISQNGNLGIGTTSPWATLSVNGNSDLGNNALAGYFTATSTTIASLFPYASTTGLTVSGSAYLGTTNLTSITGSTQCLHVNSSGTISGTGSDCGSGGLSLPVSVANGGTATTTTVGIADLYGVKIMNDYGLGIENYKDDSPNYAGQMAVDLAGVYPPQLYFSNGTGVGGFNKSIGIPAGVSQIGSQYDMANGVSSVTYLDTCGDPAASSCGASSDSGLELQSWATSTTNSGNSLIISIMAPNGNGTSTVVDPVGLGFSYSPWNRIASLIPGTDSITANASPQYNTGFYISSPAAAGFDTGNYSYMVADYINKLFRIPLWKPQVYEPNQTSYQFTVSGITTAPSLDTTYTAGTGQYTITATSLAGSPGSISGTINGTGTSTPPSSGTLTRIAIPSFGVGDATISYSAKTVLNVWADAMTVNPATGLTTLLNASTTGALSAQTICLTGDICRTTWPSSSAVGGSANQIEYNNGGSSLGGVANFLQSGGNINILAGGGILQGGDNFLFASTTNENYAIGNNDQSHLNTTEAGTDNISIGDNALHAVTTGGQNYCIGASACGAITSSSQNFGLGGAALESLTNGGTGQNIAIGTGAMQFAHGDTGRSVMIGVGAGGANSTYLYSTGVGWSALSSNNGNANTALGDSSCDGVSTGTGNTCIGAGAGVFEGGLGITLTVGSNNTLLGGSASVLNNSISNSIAIGVNAVVGASNALTLGGVGANSVNVGIGTSSPWGLLSISTTTSNTTGNPFFIIASSSPNITGTTTEFIVGANGNVGVATSSPWKGFSVNGTVSLAGLTTSGSAQADGLCLSSNNEVISDTASCVASAQRFKENITDLTATSSLNEVMELQPVSFYYKPDFNGVLQSDPNYSSEQVGFIADEVQKIDPRLVVVETATTTFEGQTYAPGTVQSVRYENMTALLAGALQDEQAEIVALQQQASSTALLLAGATGTPDVLGGQLADSQSFVASIAEAILNYLNSIGGWIFDHIQANTIDTDTIQTQTASVTNGLQMTDQSTGQIYCVTIENGNFDKELGTCSNTNTSGSNTSSTTSSGSQDTNDATSTSSQPPIISINGNNPDQIAIDSTYSDLGATITGPQADLNLGIHTSGTVDTTTVGTYTITYTATDQNGLTATSTRTVNVYDPNAIVDDTASSTGTSTND